MDYPWEAAVFYWDTNNLNDKADTGDIHQVIEVVNRRMGSGEYEKKSAYINWMNY